MYQYSQGKSHTQGHKGIPEGSYEEEQGRKGFFGQVSHLIKSEPPTNWVDIDGPLKPHLYDLVEYKFQYNQWHRLMYNNDVTIYSWWNGKTELKKETTQIPAIRNCEGETLLFCHQGSGAILTEYGLLKFETGSYINIPRSIHFTPIYHEKTQFLVIESHTGLYREPDRGMVGKNAFYDPASFGKPNLDELQKYKSDNKVETKEIQIRRLGTTTTFKYDKCVYTTLSWKGDLFPFTLHINDMMPMMSHRVHLPPSAHTTFASNGFVVRTFLPRPIETDADALKVPFYHQNIDYDEVLFYHAGDFFSRDNLHPNMMTFHPAGFPHGPHPKAFKNQGKKTFTDEVAVMIDTWNPLHIDASLGKVELVDYWKSWMSK